MTSLQRFIVNEFTRFHLHFKGLVKSPRTQFCIKQFSSPTRGLSTIEKLNGAFHNFSITWKEVWADTKVTLSTLL